MSFSSPEREYYGICSAGAELMYVGELLAILGYQVQRKVLTDATSARALAVREGVSRLRHVQTKYLWIQQKVKLDTLKVSAVLGIFNPACIGTKYVRGERRAEILEVDQPEG